jgi:hypothetical protein
MKINIFILIKQDFYMYYLLQSEVTLVFPRKTLQHCLNFTDETNKSYQLRDFQ